MTSPTSLPRVLCETPKILEDQYRHVPAKDSPVTYPLAAAQDGATCIPLAKGAEQYYRERGYL